MNNDEAIKLVLTLHTHSVRLHKEIISKDLTLTPALEYVQALELQSVSWILAEFCYNRSPQGPYTGTCTILQETINGFLCPLIVFRKM